MKDGCTTRIYFLIALLPAFTSLMDIIVMSVSKRNIVVYLYSVNFHMWMVEASQVRYQESQLDILLSCMILDLTK
jgi:hypothetical protein